MNSEEDVAHDSLIAEIRKINTADRKKSERAHVKNSRFSREYEVRAFKLGKIFFKTGGGKAVNQKKLHSLVAPLESIKAKRLQREAGFERVAIEANKWHGIVQERRKADQLHFPLEQVDLRVLTSEKNYKPRIQTDLEKKVYGLLQGSNLDTQEKEETEEEKAISKAMSLEEIRERSREIMQNRSLKMRIERKAALLNKSKSRKYHKILRRERVKRKKEEFERLKMENPAEALEALNELEKTRITERMDLRHKNSRWIRLQQSRAPHDGQIRDLLKENTEMRQELLEKLKLMQENDKDNSDGNDDDDDDDELNNTEASDPHNWETESKPDESFYKIKQYWESINTQKLTELEALKVVKEYEEKGRDNHESKGLQEEEEEEEEEQEKVVEENKSLRTIKIKVTEVKEKEEQASCEKEEEEEQQLSSIPEQKHEEEIVKKESKKRKKKKKKKNVNSKNGNEQIKNKTESEVKCKEDKNENIKRKLETCHNKNIDKNNSNFGTQNKPENQNKKLIKEIDKNLDMKTAFETVIQNEKQNTKKEEVKQISNIGFSNVYRKLGTARHDIGFLKRKLNNDESDSDEDEGLGSIITSSDDYVKEFAEEKKSHEEEIMPKDIDNFKAGWGNWGGPGIVHSDRIKEKFRIKAPKARRNKYSNIGNVIYREKCDMHQNLRKHMVSELPFPFTTVKDFEASIRQPIGRTFVPEVSHKKLIAPGVVQKMGTIIKPMDEECLIKRHEDYKKRKSDLEKELEKKLRSVQPAKKRKMKKDDEENKERKAKKKNKNRKKPKPLILI